MGETPSGRRRNAGHAAIGPEPSAVRQRAEGPGHSALCGERRKQAAGSRPTTILSFAAIFAGLGLGAAAGGYGPATLMVVGVFLGSAFWWLLLSTGVGFLRSSITPAHLRWVNRGAAAIITAFGIGALVGLLA